jgi:hypothetical protein
LTTTLPAPYPAAKELDARKLTCSILFMEYIYF